MAVNPGHALILREIQVRQVFYTYCGVGVLSHTEMISVIRRVVLHLSAIILKLFFPLHYESLL